ncbi:F-box/kelch-repeat protein [Cardamine amara subsp. amara]|uniref:F-box/kelch-repeat protein n=1 Tax=Cardamine amara subsp. amara TaxID=228776 RepID=A0ABD0Z6K4_CARAN
MNSKNVELPNKSNVHHPLLPPLPPPLPLSFLSLPEDIVLSCLARIPKSYYPKLTLVSKSFRSLILSKMLYKVRKELGTQEECVYLGILSPLHPSIIWFSLWIKPDHQTLTQEKSTRNLLVPVPSAYSFPSPYLTIRRVGSEDYVFPCQKSLSSSVLCRGVIGKWRDAPSMLLARKEPLMCVLQDKIYVMGGCRADEHRYWAEVFDPKTQTWKPLPDPDCTVKLSLYKKLIPGRGMIFVKTKRENFVYLIKENKWELYDGPPLVDSFCEIENVLYSYGDKQCLWFETKSEEWRSIKGLTGLDAYSINDTAIGNYGGKLVIFWDSPTLDHSKQIWCAVVLLDKSLDGEVWGQIEWVDVVHTVHGSLLPSLVNIHSCVVENI